MRVTFVTTGLEHLGVSALSAYLRAHGHDTCLVYEARPFSSGSGTDVPALARLLEPAPAEVAARVVATRPDVVAFSSYTVTHRWAVQVARAVKAALKVPIVFGGPHVGADPAHAITEPSIDAVVEGEGEGALLDLVECAERDGFGRDDIPNVTTSGPRGVRRNPVRPLIADLDSLPFADKSGFYEAVPGYEREFYVISRRGCPFRCSFCEYSFFPRHYPGEKPVRRRSVDHLLREVSTWKARGRVRKVFFWDPIFTLDPRWVAELADRWPREIGLPFECYTHPNAMTEDMAGLLARAGCIMVRVGVQTVNSDTLAAVDRRGDAERIRRSIEALAAAGIEYTVDHIIGLPGEGAADQLAALRFYNEVRPMRIIAHWMTYFPGTTAFERARAEGRLGAEDALRILDGDIGPGYAFDGNVAYPDHDDLRRLSNVFDLLPLLPPSAVSWMLDSGAWRNLPTSSVLRQVGVAGLALRGDEATRERVLHIFASVVEELRSAVARRARRRAA
ncbi:MAG: hypothetical protein AMXMBFR64_41260 [Myxococcales bacterium]